VWRRLSSGDWWMRESVAELECRACMDDNVTTSPRPPASSHTTTTTLSTTTATVWRRDGPFHAPTCRRRQVEMRRLHSAPERRRTACCTEPEETGLGAVSRTEVRDRCCGTDFRLTRNMHKIYLQYIHFISPSTGSNNTQNIHTHTLTHTSIHTQIIYTHIRYDPLRGGADTPFHALDMYKPNFNSNLCMRLAHRTLRQVETKVLLTMFNCLNAASFE